MQPSICRFKSLDALQHLSADGFLRSWLPSYANVSKVFLSGGTGAKYCYISVYKLQLPKWHNVMSVSAGRVRCLDPDHTATAAAGQQGAKGDQQQGQRQAQDDQAQGQGLCSCGAAAGPDGPGRGFGHEAASCRVGTNPRQPSEPRHTTQHTVSLHPDLRHGTLSLVCSSDSHDIKLLWSERAAQPQYSSIFEAEPEAASSDETAEWSTALSHTRTVIR